MPKPSVLRRLAHDLTVVRGRVGPPAPGPRPLRTAASTLPQIRRFAVEMWAWEVEGRCSHAGDVATNLHAAAHEGGPGVPSNQPTAMSPTNETGRPQTPAPRRPARPAHTSTRVANDPKASCAGTQLHAGLEEGAPRQDDDAGETRPRLEYASRPPPAPVAPPSWDTQRRQLVPETPNRYAHPESPTGALTRPLWQLSPPLRFPLSPSSFLSLTPSLVGLCLRNASHGPKGLSRLGNLCSQMSCFFFCSTFETCNVSMTG